MKPRTLDPERITKAIRVPMDTSGFALPKPEPREKAQPKGGRVIEKSHGYSKSKERMWRDQGRRCVRVDGSGKVCGRYLPSPAFAHRHHLPRTALGGKISHGRGLGGGKRDDSRTALICGRCHDLEKYGKFGVDQ